MLKTFEQLAELILCTIRIDIRSRTIHFLDLAMQKVKTRLCNISPFIDCGSSRVTIAWNETWGNQTRTLSTSTPTLERVMTARRRRSLQGNASKLGPSIAPKVVLRFCRFIFDGLGTLMEHLLIANSRHIRFANEVGIQKIMRNMLALQQNLKTITEVSQDADFERAKKYWALFSLTPTVCSSLFAFNLIAESVL